jgi:hypothetical protein
VIRVASVVLHCKDFDTVVHYTVENAVREPAQTAETNIATNDTMLVRCPDDCGNADIKPLKKISAKPGSFPA